jgi:glutamyl-tRNA synthetase
MIMATNTHDVRVRFAPSPTGQLHVGGLRSALFNWLFARHHGGSFLLRIEDTDQERSQAAYTQAIIDTYDWVDITSDEPVVYQSERIDIYQAAIEKLLTHNAVYWSDAADEERGASLLRFRVPRDTPTFTFYDRIKGEITIDRNQIEDFAIARPDGSPLYNFVVVIDDIAMRISHVIRGEDHIANTPKQILLYEALGETVPVFAHIPLILGQSGQRLSKREAATSARAYREQGFLPDALCNYLVRLGWSHQDQEMFTRDEMINLFSLDGVSSSGAAFDIEKLRWVNSVYLHAMSIDDLVTYIQKYMQSDLYSTVPDWSTSVVNGLIQLYQPRVSTIVELLDAVKALYVAPSYDSLSELHDWGAETAQYIADICDRIDLLDDFSPDCIKQEIKQFSKEHAIKLSAVGKPLRFALTGSAAGPSVFDLMSVLGKDVVMRRCRALSAILKDR